MIEFSKKNIEIKTLGERLREIREKAGISIDEIAKVTKVNKRYLEYIEDDNYEALPSDVYVRGFLRSYSNYLGIEAEDVLKIYKKEQTIQSNIKKPKKQNLKKKNKKLFTIILPLKLIMGILVGIFFVFIAWYFYSQAGKFATAPRLLISAPFNNAIIKNSAVNVVGVTDIGSKVTVNGQVIFVNEKGEFKERISLREGINKLIIKAVNKFDKEISKEITLSAQYKDKLDIYNQKEEDKNNQEEDSQNKNGDNKIRLYIKAKDTPVWISVKIDGVKKHSGTMLAGAEQIFEGDQEITITSGMANQTLVKTDAEGEYHILADKAGVIRDVAFNKGQNQEVANDKPKNLE